MHRLLPTLWIHFCREEKFKYFNSNTLIMDQLTYQNVIKAKTLEERIYAKAGDERSILSAKELDHKRLSDILTLYGVLEHQNGKIVLGKEGVTDDINPLDLILEGVYNIETDYKSEIEKFYSRHNRKNPYRFEITFEKRGAKTGALVYSFGKWIKIPYWNPDADTQFNDIPDAIPAPRYALVVYRPEKTKLNQKIINHLCKKLKYNPIHIRFGNDLEKSPYGSLILSRYMSNHFEYRGSKEEIAKRWGFLIPGLNKVY